MIGILSAALAGGSVSALAEPLKEEETAAASSQTEEDPGDGNGTSAEESSGAESSGGESSGEEASGGGPGTNDPGGETGPGEDPSADPSGTEDGAGKETSAGEETSEGQQDPAAEESGTDPEGEEDNTGDSTGDSTGDKAQGPETEGSGDEETTEDAAGETEENDRKEKEDRHSEVEKKKKKALKDGENGEAAEDPVPDGTERRLEIPARTLTYSVRHYKKVRTILVCCTSEADIREFPDASSDGTVAARLAKGAVVRLLDETDPDWWFIETRDRNGRVVRGYAESSRFRKISAKRIRRAKEDPEKVTILKEVNAGFGAVEKTTYDELALKEGLPGMREDVLNDALQVLGTPYLEGGSSLTEGTDDAGLVRAVYGGIGIPLPGTLEEQYAVGTKIPVKKAQPGDLIYYIDDNGATEVMICLSAREKGRIQVIRVSPETGRVIVDELDRSVMSRARTFDRLNAESERPENEVIDLGEWTPVGASRITSYCYDCNTPAHSAVTASGIPATEWHTVAVDSSVIPLGAKVYIEGYGVFVAEDTGVKGKWCDLYVYHSECCIWDLTEVYYKI